MDKVFIEGFTVFARHGVHPEEAVLGQRFIFDVELQVDLRLPARSDHLADTVDYGTVMARVARVAEARHCRLLEALAESVIADLFATFPSVRAVRLRVHKPAAPVPGTFSAVGIEMTRERSP